MPEYDERDFNREEWGEELSNIQPRILRDDVYGDPRDWRKKPTRPASNGMRSHVKPGQIPSPRYSKEYIQESEEFFQQNTSALRQKLAELEREEAEAEREIANEVLAGALQGDFNDNPTFWSDVGQIVTGLIPVAGQLGDIRDLVHILDDITNKEGYKKIGSWATLVLIAIGFIPGIGDGIKSIGKRGLGYLDNNRILKQMGEFLGENIIAPILNSVGDLTAPIVDLIKDAIRRKLTEAQEIARQLGEGVDNVIDDVTGRPQVATEGAGNVPSRMETEPPVRGNEPMQSRSNSDNGGNRESSSAPKEQNELVFEPSPKHTSRNRGNISRGPTNGQASLNRSVQVKRTSTRRVGVDQINDEIVVFDETTPGIFHGHVRTWNQLRPEMQNVLRRAGYVDRRGRIIK